MRLTATLSNISRGSIHDGPGVRSVVYFKGCNLSCKWCHNPETFSKKTEILYYENKCIKCGKCIEVCSKNHKVIDNAHVFCRQNCVGCGKCTDVCPSKALSVCGKRFTVKEVMDEVLKDKHYYDSSCGGVTLSGGECLVQSSFCAELLKALKEKDTTPMWQIASLI